MAIPEAQLETWAHQGAITTSKKTADCVKQILKSDSVLKDKDFDLYLQGSYKNDTNIRGDSDVDIVAQLNTTFGFDLSRLGEEEIRMFRQAYPDATYQWKEFRKDVLKAILGYYGNNNIAEGDKAIKVIQMPGYLAADIVVCIHYRKYAYFNGPKNQSYIDGIKFYTRKEGRVIVNYPKEHYENGKTKNSTGHTSGWYKPAVRTFKNARSFLIDHDIITNDQAPSYFIECLIYNAPDENFGKTYQDSYYNILSWLNTAELHAFRCQHEQGNLFGNTPEQWNISDANSIIEAWIQLWNNWS